MRNYKIVNLRALAIITVVFGHSIILYSSSWNIIETSVSVPLLDQMKNVINLYQMQLYFLISGYLMYSNMKKNSPYLIFIKGKFERLIIPYFFFGLLWMIPVKNFLSLSQGEGVSYVDLCKQLLVGINNGHLWFLYSLFIIFAIAYALNKGILLIAKKMSIVKNKNLWSNWVILNMLAIFPLLMQSLSFSFFNLNEVLLYIFWFQLGVAVKSLSNKQFSLAVMSCSFIFVWTSLSFLIGLAIVLSLYFCMPNKENNVASIIDKHSFGIYLFHSPLIYITYIYLTDSNPLLVIFINFIVMGGIAFGLTYMFKKSRINNYIKI